MDSWDHMIRFSSHHISLDYDFFKRTFFFYAYCRLGQPKFLLEELDTLPRILKWENIRLKLVLIFIIFIVIFVEIVYDTLLYMIFQYGWEPVKIKRILIRFEAIFFCRTKFEKYKFQFFTYEYEFFSSRKIWPPKSVTRTRQCAWQFMETIMYSWPAALIPDRKRYTYRNVLYLHS